MNKFVLEKMSGYGNSHMLMKHINVFHQVMETPGYIRFYRGKVEMTVDVGPGDTPDEIKVYCYANNDMAYIGHILDGKADEVKALMENAQKDLLDSTRQVFTLDIENMKILCEDDFNYYSIPRDTGFYMFTINTETVKGGFPTIYVISPPKDGPQSDLFEIQVAASQWIMDTVGKPTDFGKKFTYSLIKSVLKGQLDVSRTREFLKDVKLPTNGTTEPHTLLKREALKKFAENCGAEKILKTRKGVIDAAPKVTSLVKVEPKSQVPSTEIFGEMTSEVHNELMTVLWKEALEKGSIRLSDMVMMGLHSAVKAVSHTNNIIVVDVDVANVARKMCIFEGALHIVPLNYTEDNDWSAFFSEDEDIIFECTEENFPISLRNSAKSLEEHIYQEKGIQ